MQQKEAKQERREKYKKFVRNRTHNALAQQRRTNYFTQRRRKPQLAQINAERAEREYREKLKKEGLNARRRSKFTHANHVRNRRSNYFTKRRRMAQQAPAVEAAAPAALGEAAPEKTAAKLKIRRQTTMKNFLKGENRQGVMTRAKAKELKKHEIRTEEQMRAEEEAEARRKEAAEAAAAEKAEKAAAAAEKKEKAKAARKAAKAAANALAEERKKAATAARAGRMANVRNREEFDKLEKEAAEAAAIADGFRGPPDEDSGWGGEGEEGQEQGEEPDHLREIIPNNHSRMRRENPNDL